MISTNDASPISIPRVKTTWFLFELIAVLTLIHTANLVTYLWVDDPKKFDYIRLIDFDIEQNIPTIFSVLLYFIISVLIFLIGVHERLTRRWHAFYWFGLGLIFLFLGFDEGTKIHEGIGDWMEQFLQADGYFYFPWFIPYVLGFIFLTVIYLRFYLTLSGCTQKEFFLAAVVFITGAVGLDILGAKAAYEAGTETIRYSVLYTIEEIMEMSGKVIFIHALLRIIEQRSITISVGGTH